ncbi:NlpC/P60 family protein [Arenibacter nanhaiticus]|uniref:NlpC/P60 family protein n=1 Tax=Arenibacter nanhaiticus TaxID=558155 RepID=A0A1M6F742_9FLAO|nr:C40 family peptidase [Arenibacter nanhaiticus]SHI93409.1 NlpC/P60 family protein [Arenibacter nanhaiticus]
MKHQHLSLLLIILLASCGVSKRGATQSDERKISVAASIPSLEEHNEMVLAPEEIKDVVPKITDQVINTALSYSGVNYRYGGTNSNGMDCSGLMYVSFGQHDISLPRSSYQMAEHGETIPLDEINKGDLVFFKTSRKSRKINHVGLVVAVEGNDVQFIHSSTSRGVIISSLREGFWNHAFVKAARVL